MTPTKTINEYGQTIWIDPNGNQIYGYSGYDAPVWNGQSWGPAAAGSTAQAPDQSLGSFMGAQAPAVQQTAPITSDAWGTWNPQNARSNLDPAFMSMARNGGAQTSYSADGRYRYGAHNTGQDGTGPLMYSIYDQEGQMGTPIWDYDANGNFIGTHAASSAMSKENFLTALAAAGGIAAFGAAAGAGAAGSGGAGATTGAGVTGFGDAGTMYAGSTAADAATLGGGASVGGGSALGATGAGTAVMGAGGGGGAGGVTGFGDAGTMYAGSDPAAASSLGGGGSMSSGSGFDLGSLLQGAGSTGDWLKLATTALGAYGGSKGLDQSVTSTRSMDPRLDGPVYGQLVPMTQGLLAGTTPQATLAGSQLLSKGSGLLGQTEPTTSTNPYLKGIADDLQRRTSDLLGQNNLAIQGNAVASGGLGGSRQGVAQGTAASKAADYLQGNVANLYGNAYNQDQNRLRQDWTLGSGMLSQGVALPFAPAQSAASVYSPFTGYGTTTNSSQSGGGWMGALGGALGAAQYGKNAGWW